MLKKTQIKIKESSKGVFLLVAKTVSGVLLGLTVALVVRGFTGYGYLGFTFVVVAITGAFLKLSQKWKIQGVLLFNLFCVMVAMLLRMYILIAPGE
ncbi:MAG: hypothetical protein IPM57_04205 [Oligoflexia bacterium]|nr:hypothetical protein [Oligoflexia bacterium]